MENDVLPLIDMAEAMARLDDDKELYLILVDTFLNNGGFDAETMMEMVSEAKPDASNQMEKASKYVHHMKGAAAQLGARRLAAQAQLLEDVLRGKQCGDKDALAETVAILYKETTTKLRLFQAE